MTKKTEYDEKALLERARSGDRDAFADLVRATQQLVYNLALRMLKNEEDALDASQEAYLRAWMGLGDFEGGCSFSSWMYTITRNVCIDSIRKKEQERTVPVTLQYGDEDEQELALTDERTETEFIFEKNERARAVRHAIGRLSEMHREIVVLCDIEGYSYSEISRILGIEEGTVKSRLWRARDNLRKILRDMELF